MTPEMILGLVMVSVVSLLVKWLGSKFDKNEKKLEVIRVDVNSNMTKALDRIEALEKLVRTQAAQIQDDGKRTQN